MIFILTGDIRSGKTTSLYLASLKRNDVGGFLTPDDGELRKLYDINKRVKHRFQVKGECTEPYLEVGRFTFLLSAFNVGSEIVREQIGVESIHYIVVDEIGKLELKDKGFHHLMEFITSDQLEQDLIVVVRSFLLEEVIEKYGLTEYQVIHDINQLW